MTTAPDSTTPSQPLTPHDWFTLFLRVLGAWELILSIDQGVIIFNVIKGNWHPERTHIEAYVTHGLASFLIAIWLLKAAPAIARFFPLSA